MIAFLGQEKDSRSAMSPAIIMIGFLGQVIRAIMLEGSLYLLHGLCSDRLLPGAGG